MFKKEVGMGKGKFNRKILSAFLTFAIISLLIFSGPASAVNVGITAISDSTPNEGSDVSFTVYVDIETEERIPVQNLTLSLTNAGGLDNYTCTFSVEGINLSSCADINITKINAVGYANGTSYGYGYGYNYFNNSGGVTNYSNTSFIDGYGYGYSAGYVNSSYPYGELAYSVTWTTPSVSMDTDYSVSFEAYVSDGSKQRTYRTILPSTITVQSLEEITLNAPVDNYNSSSTNLTYNFTATSNLSTNFTCNITVNGLTNISNIAAIKDVPQVNSSFYGEGNYIWNITCLNNINTTINSLTRTFTIDTTLPTTAPNLTSASDSNQDGNIELNWTADSSAAKYGVFRSAVNITNATNATRLANATGTSFIDNTSLHNIQYWYAVTSIDYAGNENRSVINTTTGGFIDGISNDTIIPKIPTYINTTQSGNTATISWYEVLYDIESNPDFTNLTYQIWNGISINMSKQLVNDTLSLLKNVNFESGNSTTWDIPSSCGSSCNYYFAVTTIDDAGNENLSLTELNMVNVTLTYTDSSDTSDSGSSSGGGAVGIVIKQTEYSRGWDEINGTVNISIDRGAIPVIYVEFYLTEKARNLQFSVKSLDGKPSHLPDMEYVSYKFLQFTVTSFDADEFKNPLIKFKVENSWLSANGVIKTDVSLYRYSDRKWNRLKTTFLNSDATYSYYSAISPGFSYFAIASSKAKSSGASQITGQATSNNNQATNGQQNLSNNDNNPATGGDGIPEEKAKLNLFLWIIITLPALVILVALIYFIVMKREEMKLVKFQNIENELNVSDVLVNYIKMQLSKGFSEQQVRNALLSRGWNKKRIDDAFDFVARN